MSIVVLDIAVLDDRDAQALAAGSTAVGYVPALDLPEGVTVESGDLVETGGDRYMVLRADLLAPSSDPILYTLSLKGR